MFAINFFQTLIYENTTLRCQVTCSAAHELLYVLIHNYTVRVFICFLIHAGEDDNGIPSAKRQKVSHSSEGVTSLLLMIFMLQLH